MATAADLRRLALALEGTREAPHWDRTAFKADRNYATLAPDGLTANLRLDPMEQELLCEANPAAFQRIANAWGNQGWTNVILAELDVAELETVLRSAWQGYGVKPRKGRK